MRISNCISALAAVLLAISCTRLPSVKLRQYDNQSWANFENDTLSIYLHNPLRCPLRFSISSTESSFNEKLKPFAHIVLEYSTDTLIKIPAHKQDLASLSIRHGFGNPEEVVNYNKFNLPFSAGTSYEIIQAYNGSFSHTDNYSRYAVDFSLKHGDTVCAATSGYVVGIVKDYTGGSSNKKWRDYANFITLYHPGYNLFTQYAHLKHNGVLVETGDYIEAGQPIGLAGRTGWTSIQHLHFNVLKAADSNEWLESVPADYYEGYNGKDFKQGDLVTRPPL